MTIKDVRRVTRRLQGAIIALAELVDTEEDDDALAALFAALDRTPHGLMQQIAIVRDGLTLKLHVRVVEDPNRARIFEGLGMLEATWSGTQAWDGVTITRRVTARAVDDGYADPLTGEVRPPAAFAEYIANELLACAGLDRASQPWRKEELRGRGIDPNEHIHRNPNPRKTVRWK